MTRLRLRRTGDGFDGERRGGNGNGEGKVRRRRGGGKGVGGEMDVIWEDGWMGGLVLGG